MKFRKKRVGAVALALAVLTACGTTSAERLDITLDEGIKMALENNYTIEESGADLDSAYWGLREARRNGGPTVSWNSTAYRVGGKSYEGWNHNALYGNQFSFSMPLYSGGKIENNIEAAEMGLSGAELDLERTKQTIRSTVSGDYYYILKCRSEVEVYQESVNNLQAHLDNVNAKLRAGVVAQKDVLSSEVSLAEEKQNLVTKINDLRVAIATFNNDVGLPMETETTPKEELKYEPYNFTLPECDDYALIHRPDLFQKMYNLKQKKAEMEAAKSGMRPKLDAGVSRNIGGSSAFKTDSVSSDSWTAGVSLSWDIFDSGITSAQVNKKKAAVHRAEAELMDKVNSVRLDVRTEYLNMRAAEENIGTMREALEKAQEDYRIEVVRYNAGVGTNLEVMDAQDKLVSAKGDFINALYKYNYSKASLDTAMGVPVDLDIEPYRQVIEKSEVKGE
ncbi:TolC family protein [Anaerovibrio lipolyticus]|uniref:TolC family protein n=1 Tax=Anaerovibrio lipolyticus TaxID=82374 RepID=UPI000686405D|nr:TolC family protein [Anaerovibrio lipolyticus]